MTKIVISSAENDQRTGDAVYNGGFKLYNLLVKLLRRGGYDAFIVTTDGHYTPWLVDHQPVVDLETVRGWINSGERVIPITGWLASDAFLRVATAAGPVHYWDCALVWTLTQHRARYDHPEQFGWRMGRVAALNRYHVGWHLQYDPEALWLPLWADPDVRRLRRTYYLPDNRQLRIGFNEVHADETVELVDYNQDELERMGLEFEFVLVRGNEAAVAEAMRGVDVWLSLEDMRHPVYGQGGPLMPVEAMHSGCLVLAMETRDDYMIHGYNGVLLPARDLDRAVEVLSLVLQQPAVYRPLAMRGAKYARQCLGPAGRLSIVQEWLGGEDDRSLLG